MNKRNVASFLWFLAGWSGGGLFVGLMGLPTILAFMPGIALALVVRTEAAAFLWQRSATGRRIAPAARIVPINQFSAELDKRLDKRVEQWPAVGAETRRG